MESKKRNAIFEQTNKVSALILAADSLADYITADGEKKEEINRFLTLFYMAVDATAELKTMTEDL